MPHPQLPTPEHWFHERATHYVEAQVLFHLNQAGVLKSLADQEPATAAQLAEGLGLRVDILTCLLEYIWGVDRILDQDAEGRFSYTDFGRSVLDRFGRSSNSGAPTLNLFDVRVGGYGPVWGALSQLLSGDAEYGRDVKRIGFAAAEGVYISSAAMAPTLNRVLGDLEVAGAVEMGVGSGLLTPIAQQYPQMRLYGLDFSEEMLDQAATRAKTANVNSISWVQHDLFDLPGWSDRIAPDVAGAFFSVHFHEFMAAGRSAMINFLRELRAQYPGWSVVALEQPRLPISDRDHVSASRWLYAQSNLLIHHLIGNGKVLSEEEWVDLFAAAGWPSLGIEDVGFLGYRAYLFGDGR